MDITSIKFAAIEVPADTKLAHDPYLDQARDIPAADGSALAQLCTVLFHPSRTGETPPHRRAGDFRSRRHALIGELPPETFPDWSESEVAPGDDVRFGWRGGSTEPAPRGDTAPGCDED